MQEKVSTSLALVDSRLASRALRSIAALIPIIVAATVAVAPRTATAQGHEHDGMAGMHHDGAIAVSAKAQKEIDSVEHATVKLGAPGAATAAGFHPVFGWIPTMGEHWVDRALMTKDKQVDRSTPSNLMFSKIAGKDSLVGAAYAYFAPVADRQGPSLFDGAPTWHEHTDLAPPGQTLVMLHVWFVPSPDGPFAGTNPNLPFWAAGLAAPDSARMRDAAYSMRVRRASLALAEIADTTSIFPNLESRPDVRAVLVPHRDSIRAIVPQLLAAQKAHDSAKWDAAADKAAAQWDAIYAGYLASVRTPAGKERVERFVAMLLGQHGE
jgi:hypothetical protein